MNNLMTSTRKKKCSCVGESESEGGILFIEFANVGFVKCIPGFGMDRFGAIAIEASWGLGRPFVLPLCVFGVFSRSQFCQFNFLFCVSFIGGPVCASVFQLSVLLVCSFWAKLWADVALITTLLFVSFA